MQPAASSSSTATTPSPPLPASAAADVDPLEREERQRAVKKFLARAECAKLTRSLRARLAYASYKAAHNLEHVPLPVLEHRIHPPAPTPAPAPAPPSPLRAPHKRPPDAAMPPPASPARSLYAALLGAPPPPKRPRHVYGPAPAPADLLPSYAPSTPARGPRRPPRSPFLNAGHGRTVRTVLQGRARSSVTEREDINAAATLTALMFTRASPRTRTPAPPADATGDADAAELMLYLATSPSPVAARRAPPPPVALGRVLFAPTPSPGASQEPGASQDSGALLPPPPSPPQKPGAYDYAAVPGLGKGIDLVVEAK